MARAQRGFRGGDRREIITNTTRQALTFDTTLRSATIVPVMASPGSTELMDVSEATLVRMRLSIVDCAIAASQGAVRYDVWGMTADPATAAVDLPDPTLTAAEDRLKSYLFWRTWNVPDNFVPEPDSFLGLEVDVKAMRKVDEDWVLKIVHKSNIAADTTVRLNIQTWWKLSQDQPNPRKT